MANVSYVPGPLTAVTGDSCLALVEAAPDSRAAAWIWQRVGQGASAGTLLAGLLGAGFDEVDGFALVDTSEDGQVRLFCRGAVSATVVGPNEAVADVALVDGVGLLTWREHLVRADAERVILGLPPDNGALRLPAAAGVLLAACVIVDLVAPPAATHPGYPAGGYPADGAQTIVRTPARHEAEVVVGLATVPDRTATAAVGGDYDFLWGATTNRSVEEAAIRQIAADHGRPGQPSPAAPLRLSPGGLIDAVSWGAAPSAPEPAEDGFTVKRADLIAGPVSRPDLIGPSVPALICPAGHLNPPGEAGCRRCSGVLPPDPVIVPRPALGLLRLSTGDVLTLDRDVVLGRNPVDGFTGINGEDRPHVVKLPSGDGDISRAHVRVTLTGWQVLVTDLNSTNGTLVTRPGHGPRQLRPGQPTPIEPGTLVVLAEGIDFRFEEPE